MAGVGAGGKGRSPMASEEVSGVVVGGSWGVRVGVDDGDCRSLSVLPPPEGASPSKRCSLASFLPVGRGGILVEGLGLLVELGVGKFLNVEVKYVGAAKWASAVGKDCLQIGVCIDGEA